MSARTLGNPGRNPKLWGGRYSIKGILAEGFERDCAWLLLVFSKAVELDVFVRNLTLQPAPCLVNLVFL